MAVRRITLADVARRAGVSPTAVSLILNDKPATRLSQDAVSRVRAAADELGYRPNLAARTLSTSKSRTIGFVSDVVATTRFSGGLIRGALDEARERFHVLLIAETGGAARSEAEVAAAVRDREAEHEAVNALLDRQVDGIIWAAMRSREMVIPDSALNSRLVVLNAFGTGAFPSILPDEFRAGRQVASEVLRAGIRTGIAVVGRRRDQASGLWDTRTVARRLDGIWSALDGEGVSGVREITCADWQIEDGHRAVRSLLSEPVALRALICMNDRIAIGAYRAVQEAGLRIPGDVAVVGFDDDELASVLDPGLTTAALPYEEMGRLAVDLVLDPAAAPRETLVPMPLRRRQSVPSPGA